MKRVVFVGLALLLFFALMPDSTQAFQGPIVPCGRAGTPPCQFCHLFVLLINIINFIMTFLTPIVAALMITVSGLMFLLSYFSEAEMLPGGAKGSPKLFSTARKTLTATIIGLVIVFAAFIFINTFFDFMGIQEWTGLKTWWDFTDKCPVI